VAITAERSHSKITVRARSCKCIELPDRKYLHHTKYIFPSYSSCIITASFNTVQLYWKLHTVAWIQEYFQYFWDNEEMLGRLNWSKCMLLLPCKIFYTFVSSPSRSGTPNSHICADLLLGASQLIWVECNDTNLTAQAQFVNFSEHGSVWRARCPADTTAVDNPQITLTVVPAAAAAASAGIHDRLGFRQAMQFKSSTY